jgi:vacuolar-type H+-ATPase subunit D/Vma8
LRSDYKSFLLYFGWSIPGFRRDHACFELEVIAIPYLFESEMQFTRLLEEIHSTTRRLKAIENILFPHLEAQRNSIRMALKERERSEHNRLKITRDILEEKHIQTQTE